MAAFSVLLLVWLIPANTSPPQSEQSVANLSAVCRGDDDVGLVTSADRFEPVKGATGGEKLHEEFGAEAKGIGWQEVRDIAVWCAFSVAMMVGFYTSCRFRGHGDGGCWRCCSAWVSATSMLAAIAIATPVVIQRIAWHAFSVQMP
ncbi:MAG: hypothetical protein R3D67_15195 [Hyphomicrobiaceae bacterium]